MGTTLEARLPFVVRGSALHLSWMRCDEVGQACLLSGPPEQVGRLTLSAEDVGRAIILVATPIGSSGEQGTPQRVSTKPVGLAPQLCHRLREAATAESVSFGVSIVRSAVKLPLRASDGPLSIEVDLKRLRLLAGKRQLWKEHDILMVYG